MKEPEAHVFKDAGSIPNNPRLPLLIYRKVVPAVAESIEALYEEHGWRAAWRYGVYPFAHYHSTSHEVLGVYRGQARIRFGHCEGIVAAVEAGDVVVIPAGVGHQNMGCSPDFHVVGGYPEGQEADLIREDAGKKAEAEKRIAKVPLPTADPIYGKRGPLLKCWRIDDKNPN